ncbi:UNVERIFIED_CONTAM: hypothetical protein GTU68_038833 [Idotea baltica]|nr:hypothetical protein [Idotea baltica]
MLEIRTNCECCHKALPANSTEAMICGFECTFCKTCVDGKLQNVCQTAAVGLKNDQSARKQN